jgi:hypothetical protein
VARVLLVEEEDPPNVPRGEELGEGTGSWAAVEELPRQVPVVGSDAADLSLCRSGTQPLDLNWGNDWLVRQLRKGDHNYLPFSVGREVYGPLCLNCGLSVAPLFFMKAMRPVAAYLSAKGAQYFPTLTTSSGPGALRATNTRRQRPKTRGPGEKFARFSRGSATRCTLRSATSEG